MPESVKRRGSPAPTTGANVGGSPALSCALAIDVGRLSAAGARARPSRSPHTPGRPAAPRVALQRQDRGVTWHRCGQGAGASRRRRGTSNEESDEHTADRRDLRPRRGRPSMLIAASSNWIVGLVTVSYTHLRAHETGRNLVCRLLL